MTLRYLSVCSGIEAATVAWHDLGWIPVGFSEIEPFPSAVLAHHYPGVPNHGDLTSWREWGLKPGSVDVLVGGTPCQSFSVAGLRRGLADPRGNLALTFLALADHLRPRWIVWENVPGVLSSSGGRDFGAFLGALAVLGYQFAWRVLDAQHFGVPQRRRRVFLVAHPRVECAAAVLFERPGGGGDPAEGAGPGDIDPAGVAGGARGDRGARGGPYWNGADVADTLDVSALVKRQTMPDKRRFQAVVVERGSHWDDPALPHPTLNQSNRANGSPGYSSQELFSQRGCGLVPDPYPAPTVFVKATSPHSADEATRFEPTDVAACLNGWDERHDPPKHMVAEPVAFNVFPGRPGEDAPAELRACETEVANAVPVTEHARATDRGTRIVEPAPMAVRRLTATECERLQGFPDGYSAIPWKGKPASECPDAPRYKALGNSMAVPVMRWIGERLAEVDAAGSDTMLSAEAAHAS